MWGGGPSLDLSFDLLLDRTESRRILQASLRAAQARFLLFIMPSTP